MGKSTGKKQGKGVYKYASGHVYDGEWQDDGQHGWGIMTWRSGNVYEGEWVEGKQHGQGTRKWEDGRIYEGAFVGGKEHGWGTMTWPSGDVHEGQWVGGKQHERGGADGAGDIYEGTWANGQRVWGKGKWANGGTSLGSNARDAPSRATTGAQSESAAPDASGKKQPEKETRIYNERKPRSQRSQQRRLQNSAAATKTCENCGANDGHYKLRVCTGCNLALYCSAACQKAASGSHRRICDIISELPPRDADTLVLTHDRDKLVDLDAGLRYATKYLDNLKHLGVDMEGMGKHDTAKLSPKKLSALLRSKKGTLESVSWVSSFNNYTPGISQNGYNVWKELQGLKHLRLRYIFDQCIHEIISQQKNTLLVLCLHYVEIGWHKAKCRRTMAHAVNSCKHLVKLDLDQCVLMDSDLKVMLQGLENLRVLRLVRHSRHTHEFTDNTCGLIARKCPGLQELNLNFHNHLSARGVRKIFEGCSHLRSFISTTCKLGSGDIRELLEIAHQLLCLSLGDKTHISDDELSKIVEATGGRTVLQLSMGTQEPDGLSAKTKKKYESQMDVLRNIWNRLGDPEVANEWEGMIKG